MLIWTRRLTLCCCLGSIVRLLSWENPAETQVASWLVSLEKQDEVNLHFKRLDEMEMGWGETEFLSPANKPQTVLRAGRPFPATVEGGGGCLVTSIIINCPVRKRWSGRRRKQQLKHEIRPEAFVTMKLKRWGAGSKRLVKAAPSLAHLKEQASKCKDS